MELMTDQLSIGGECSEGIDFTGWSSVYTYEADSTEELSADNPFPTPPPRRAWRYANPLSPQGASRDVIERLCFRQHDQIQCYFRHGTGMFYWRLGDAIADRHDVTFESVIGSAYPLFCR